MFRQSRYDALLMRSLRQCSAVCPAVRRAHRVPSPRERPRLSWLILFRSWPPAAGREAVMGRSQPAGHRRAHRHRPHARAAAVCPCQPSSPTASRWNGSSCRPSPSRTASPPRSAGVAARSSSAWRCRPNAAYPAQTLTEELFVIVQDGSATIDVGRKTAALGKNQAIYLQPGAVRSMKAGTNGLLAFEVYSPVRLDHLALAGQNTDRRQRHLSGSRRDAVAPAGRRRRPQRHPMDAAHGSGSRESRTGAARHMPGCCGDGTRKSASFASIRSRRSRCTSTRRIN